MTGYILNVQIFHCSTEREAEVTLSGLEDELEAKKYIEMITNYLIEAQSIPDGDVSWNYQVSKIENGKEEYVSGDALFTRVENRKIVFATEGLE